MRRILLAFAGPTALLTVLAAAPAHADTGPEQARITAHLSAGRIGIGQTATISGTVKADGPSGWQPLADQPVSVFLLNAGLPSPMQVTTNAQGAYSAKIPAAPGSLGQASITTYFNADGSNSAYSTATSPTLTLNVPVTRSFIGGESSTDPFGTVTLAGSFNPPLTHAAPVSIQYSPNGTGQWKQMAVAHADSGGYFTGTAHAMASGYWRARYNGDANNYPITAFTIKNWRWNTHFTRFKATRSGSKVKVSGTLARYFSTTRQGPFAHQAVHILFRFRGKKTWYLIGTLHTNTKGQFSGKVKHYAAGSYLALFEGTDTTWASQSAKPITLLASLEHPATSLNSPIPAGLPLPTKHTQYIH